MSSCNLIINKIHNEFILLLNDEEKKRYILFCGEFNKKLKIYCKNKKQYEKRKDTGYLNKYYEQNKEKHLNYVSTYYEQNKDKIKKYSLKYYHDNKSYEKNKEYYEKHKNRLKRYFYEYYHYKKYDILKNKSLLYRRELRNNIYNPCNYLNDSLCLNLGYSI